MSFVAASATYSLDYLLSFDLVAEKWEAWLMKASAEGASLAVFPEYGAIEALPSLNPEKAGDLAGQIELMAEIEARLVAFWREMAVKYEMHILAPSLPEQLEAGIVVNRAYLFAPDGGFGFQDKMVPTVFERELWGLSAGGPLKLFETQLGKTAVLICYDCEFPMLARAAVEAGAEVLLVPSCTDTLDGYWRVRIAAMARALEGQCYVVQAAMAGVADWSPSTDENFGAAGFFGPPDLGFPDNGIVAVGELNQPGWVTAEIDIDRVHEVRRNGAVRPFTHWPEQGAALMAALEPVNLAGAEGFVGAASDGGLVSEQVRGGGEDLPVERPDDDQPMAQAQVAGLERSEG